MRRLTSPLAFCLISVVVAGTPASAGVKLRATLQKFREFYAIDDPRIPVSIRNQLARPARTTQRGGARWTIEADAIVRTRTSGPRSAAGSASRNRISFEDGLPVGGLHAIAIATDGAVWAGGDEGLVRYADSSHNRHGSDSDDGRRSRERSIAPAGWSDWNKWQYFSGRRYLPSDEVISLATGEAGSIWVKTSAGISHIEFRRLTLADKAAYFERRITERHKRHYLVADSEFSEPGAPATSHQYPSDNDGLWTAIYVAAEAFRYRVSEDPHALDAMRKSADAMLRLEAITGRPGFPARSFRKKDEPRHQDGIWHFTPDGEWEWKGDTSSDEIVGHFFAYSVVYDLAADEDLKIRLRGAVSRMADHLIDHQYNLTDLHGGPTRWGRYDPAYFETEDGREERALRSLELLSHLKVAYHMTGNARYDQEYKKLINEMGYHKNTTSYLKLREELNYSDEELAMLSYYPLFRYEKDPELLGVYREGLEQWWVNIQREDNALWIFIYDFCNPGKRVGLEAAARTLYRIPMDLIRWSVKNSNRRDVPLDTSAERHDKVQTSRLLAPDERRVMKWNGNPFQLDDLGAGRGEDDGSFFLLPYWMGRYHGFLRGL